MLTRQKAMNMMYILSTFYCQLIICPTRIGPIPSHHCHYLCLMAIFAWILISFFIVSFVSLIQKQTYDGKMAYYFYRPDLLVITQWEWPINSCPPSVTKHRGVTKFGRYSHCLHVQQIAELQKENFSLKLRIYFLEERTKKDGIADGDVYNTVCAF